jgi:hypothetical protein
LHNVRDLGKNFFKKSTSPTAHGLEGSLDERIKMAANLGYELECHMAANSSAIFLRVYHERNKMAANLGDELESHMVAGSSALHVA